MRNIILIVLILAITQLVADPFDNPISLSLGDAFMLRSTDFRALGWNPAQLSRFDNKLTLGLGRVNFNLNNNSLSLSFYNDLMGKKLDENGKQELLDKIPESGLGLDLNIGGASPLFSLTYKNFAFTSTADLLATSRFSHELFDFLIDDLVFKKYDFSDSRGQMAAVIEYHFGYGHKVPVNDYLSLDLPPIYTGIGIGYIYGINYAEITRIRSEFINSEYGITMDNYIKIRTSGVKRGQGEDDDEIDFNSGLSAKGSGFRMDLGFASELSPELTIGLSLKNIFGVIVWREDCEEHIFSTYGDSLYLYMEDEDLDDAITSTDTTYTISKITQNIPFEIHFGAKYQLSKLNLFADYVQGFDTSVYTSAQPKLSLGGEYFLLKWLPLRLGFGLGEERSSHFSLGSGLVFRKFELNWASRTYYSPIASYSKGMSFALSMMLKFN